MRAWVLDGGFGLSQIRLVARDRAPLGPHDVRVRMTAWSLNYRDYLIATGAYNPRQPLPLVLGSDGVGHVIEVGSAVTRVTLGQRLMPNFAQKWRDGPLTRQACRSTLGAPHDGVFADEVVLSEEGFVAVPQRLSDSEGATLPCAAVTAWSALQHAGVGPGSKVLIEGTGGVALFALQFSQLLGASIRIVTSKSDEKLARATTLGATKTIHYQNEPHWGRAARTLAGGDGVDCVLDVGGSATLPEAIQAVRPGGTICIIGMLGGRAGPLDVVPLLMNQLRLQGIFVGSRSDFESMTQRLATSTMRPQIDRTFPFEALPEALSTLATGSHFGKLCLVR